MDLSDHSARVLQVVLIFVLSGIMHMCASFKLQENARPVSNELLFFCIQPLAIHVTRKLRIFVRKATVSLLLSYVFNTVAFVL